MGFSEGMPHFTGHVERENDDQSTFMTVNCAYQSLAMEKSTEEVNDVRLSAGSFSAAHL